MQYQIPHGVGVAMTLAQVAERNRGAFPEEDELFALFEKFGGVRGFLEQISEGVMSLKLKDYGVEQEDIPQIAQHTFTLGRMDNNPVAFSQQDVIEILEEIYE